MAGVALVFLGPCGQDFFRDPPGLVLVRVVQGGRIGSPDVLLDLITTDLTGAADRVIIVAAFNHSQGVADWEGVALKGQKYSAANQYRGRDGLKIRMPDRGN